MNRDNSKGQIARIENAFIFHAQYKLPARDQKILLYIISKISPKSQKEFNKQVVSVKELERALKKDGKKWGGLYSEMKSFQNRMMDAKIVFPTDIKIGGKKFPGMVSWFQSISPVKDKDDNVGLEFLFSSPLKPFLLDLKEYARINYSEVIPLRSGFAARMFQVFRAHRDKKKRYEKNSTLKYEIEDLKYLLGVGDKYADWRNFKRKVVEVVVSEITEHTSIRVKFEEIRKGRKVIGVAFLFSDKRNYDMEELPEALDISQLTYAQIRAFYSLTEYHIQDVVAKEMLGKVKGSEFRGFEDWYFEEIIQIFESKTKQTTPEAKAGTLVNWFIREKIFEQGDHFARIMEKLQNRKKMLQQKNAKAWGNRLLAREMAAREFEALVKG